MIDNKPFAMFFNVSPRKMRPRRRRRVDRRSVATEPRSGRKSPRWNTQTRATPSGPTVADGIPMKNS